MNSDITDFTKDVPMGGNNNLHATTQGSSFYQKPQFSNNNDCSPLLRDPSPQKKFDRNGYHSYQNRYNSSVDKLQNTNKTSLYNRLGHRKFESRNNNSDNFQNTGSNFQNTGNSQRNYKNNNRKRQGESKQLGPVNKRKWSPNKTPFYQNSNNQQNHNSAQERLNRIRSQNDFQVTTKVEPLYNYNESDTSYNQSNTVALNDPQDVVDATDITVEVVNNTVVQEDDKNLTRFKMVLDPKTQASIKLIQNKRKDKQVIFPFPVTPNVTGATLHERFSML